ncbi:MAG: ATP-dependent zinc protease [Alcanivoracaceae bacterium]|nr:ATP-dependent zinc protease [Alcanivoracaceae bacterium]
MDMVGWREWVALPALGIDAIKAKVDTGARTSALHAFQVSPFERDGQDWVRFSMHPFQHDGDTVVECEAPVADRRTVTDSGGHREERYVIETDLLIAGATRRVEVTLTDRETMIFRMLIGRTAMQALTVDPSASFLLGGSKEAPPASVTDSKE